MSGKSRRVLAALVLSLASLWIAGPTAQAAPECRGVIQCWDERVRECVSNLTLPPGRC